MRKKLFAFTASLAALGALCLSSAYADENNEGFWYGDEYFPAEGETADEGNAFLPDPWEDDEKSDEDVSFSPFYTSSLPDGTLKITGYDEFAVGEDVEIPSTIDGKQVTEIGDSLFFFNSIKSVVIPEGVTKIGSNVFSCCAELTSVTLPTTLQAIGQLLLRAV